MHQIALLLALALGVNEYKIEIKDVHDADTITVNIIMDYNVGIFDVPMRLMDFDAYEITRTRRTIDYYPDEIELGIKARTELIELLKEARRTYIQPGEIAVYGRYEGRLFIETKKGVKIEVSKFMKEHGHDRTLDPRFKK